MRKKHLNLFDGRFISEVRPSVVARSALTGSVDNDLLQCEKTVSTSDPLFAASRSVRQCNDKIGVAIDRN